MNKLFIALSMASVLVFQAPAVSISAQLNGNQSNQPNNKAAKVIVACACEDLFPALQDVLVVSKSDIKDIVKIQLNTMGLNKEQLNSVKLMIKEAAPLVLEGIQVCARLAKKHGKDVLAIAVTVTDKAAIALKNNDFVQAEADQEALERVFDLVIDDAGFQNFMEKVDAFNEKWAESFAALMQASAMQDSNVSAVKVQKMQDSMQKIFASTLSNKRAVRIQSLVIPVISSIKTQVDILRIVQACLVELETNLSPLVGSVEKFAGFALPFAATAITESIDETLQSMPA